MVYALEFAKKGITINTIAPGFIESDMTQSLTEDQKANIMQKIPMGRMGRPEEIASAVKFFISNCASYITGSILHVNGGMYMP